MNEEKQMNTYYVLRRNYMNGTVTEEDKDVVRSKSLKNFSYTINHRHYNSADYDIITVRTEEELPEMNVEQYKGYEFDNKVKFNLFENVYVLFAGKTIKYAKAKIVGIFCNPEYTLPVYTLDILGDIFEGDMDEYSTIDNYTDPCGFTCTLVETIENRLFYTEDEVKDYILNNLVKEIN